MWKYMSRRFRDTIERGANYFDKRSTTGLANNPNNNDNNRNSDLPCSWYRITNCGKFRCDDPNGTKRKRSYFDYLNSSWQNAITWSGAVVLGWYATQLIQLKTRSCLRKANRKELSAFNCLVQTLSPYTYCVNKQALYLEPGGTIQHVVNKFIPTVHLVSNDQNDIGHSTNSTPGSASSETSNNDSGLGDVLNSIENKLGLAAIENGQHQNGLNLLRSAANRNHAPALYNLGLCYEMGLGVEANEKMAMELYRSAAALEHAGALYNLGIYYGQGRGGLSCDMEMAKRLVRIAALKGQEDAISALKALDINVHEPLNTDIEKALHPASEFTPGITQTHIVSSDVNSSFPSQCLETSVY